MYAIAGVSGNTGKVVADALLARGEKVRVIVRDAAKGEPWKARGAEVSVASLDDQAALSKALSGATAAYVLIPPDASTTDMLARNRGLVDVLAGALDAAKVPHVVYLSSVAAHIDGPTGPIRTHFYGEPRMRKVAGTRFTFLRPSYFMENLGALLGAVQGAGVLPAFFATSKKIPMIATHDIGVVAAQALLEPPAVTQVIELTGPADYSFDDAAASFSRRLGKPVAAIRVPDEGVVPALTQAGLSANVAGLYAEMSRAVESGSFGFEGGSARFLRGTTTLDTQIGKLLGQ